MEDTEEASYGDAKHGAGFGYSGMRGLNELTTTFRIYCGPYFYLSSEVNRCRSEGTPSFHNVAELTGSSPVSPHDTPRSAGVQLPRQDYEVTTGNQSGRHRRRKVTAVRSRL